MKAHIQNSTNHFLG